MTPLLGLHLLFVLPLLQSNHTLIWIEQVLSKQEL
jgi:hypothetical protein